MASTRLPRGWTKHVESSVIHLLAHSTVAIRPIRAETEARNRRLMSAIESGVHPSTLKPRSGKLGVVSENSIVGLEYPHPVTTGAVIDRSARLVLYNV